MPCLERHASIDLKGGSGHIGGVVRNEVECGIRNLLRLAYTAQRLTSYKLLPHLRRIAQTLMERRRIYRAGTEAIHPNVCGSIIDRHGTSHREHSALCRAIGSSVGNGAQRSARGRAQNHTTALLKKHWNN